MNVGTINFQCCIIINIFYGSSKFFENLAHIFHITTSGDIVECDSVMSQETGWNQFDDRIFIRYRFRYPFERFTAVDDEFGHEEMKKE